MPWQFLGKLVILSAFLIGLVLPGITFVGTPTVSAANACTYTIPATLKKVDGLGNYANVKPGDTLCLPAGSRGILKIFNLHGTAGSPITIQNSGGIVKFTGSTAFLSILSSSYVRLTGAGVEDKCGAEYSPTEQACGIEFDHSYKGIIIDTNGADVHDFEIDHVLVHDTSTQINSRGIAIHPLDRQIVSGLYAHHNYILNTFGEGLYIGTEPQKKPYDELGKMRNVEISYNLVEQTGYDGIKVKVGIENVAVHHNIVRNAGTRRVSKHESGIQLATSVGQVYNNYVAAILEGIATGRPLANPGTRYFNNIVVGGQTSCIDAAESNPQIYNNTLVGCGTVGVKANGTSAQIFDNIVVNTSGTAINAPANTVFNNLTGSSSTAGFVNAAGGDYHLLANSPAVDAGRNSGLFPPFDYDDVSRPQGAKTDLGAYEFVP
ncbi:MAG: hypothetical protein HY782_11340 [Chloroflexi bacterium]|nr:hypothetical protein [Chloroflexota bacterium]